MLYPSEPDPYQTLRRTGCLVMATMLFFGCIVPWLFVEFAQTALGNLHLNPVLATLVLIGSLLGSAVNIPVFRAPLPDGVLVRHFTPVGGWDMFPRRERTEPYFTVAVNVGGCVIPALLAIWLARHLPWRDPRIPVVLGIGTLLNVFVCRRTARLIPGMGIALPFFLPASVALATTWLGLASPRYEAARPAVAYLIGIAGPLIGADLLHWRDFARLGAGLVSIGGAGTWDGIVLTGLLAAFFA